MATLWGDCVDMDEIIGAAVRELQSSLEQLKLSGYDAWVEVKGLSCTLYITKPAIGTGCEWIENGDLTTDDLRIINYRLRELKEDLCPL